MKAHVDQDGCIGCGLCADTCPEVFRMDENGLAEAYGEVTQDNLAAAKDARDACPVSVITLEE